MKFGKSRLFALAAAHGASLLAVPAVLQAAETTGQLEEIVVTARQRSARQARRLLRQVEQAMVANRPYVPAGRFGEQEAQVEGSPCHLETAL